MQGLDNKGGPDIDIWVADPLGQVINTSEDKPIRLGPTPEGGRADFDDRGAYGQGDGGGPERIFWPVGKAPAGKYRYGVKWFKGLGAARYALRVYRGKKLAATKIGQLTDNDRDKRIELGVIVNGKE